MLSPKDIATALRAGRIVPLGVKNPHGPFGLEQLAAAVARVPRGDETSLVLTVRPETRSKLERLALAEGEAASRAVTVEEVASAIVEEFVSAAPLP